MGAPPKTDDVDVKGAAGKLNEDLGKITEEMGTDPAKNDDTPE